mmetsp:Transcript_129095/g.373614  ORF Transcript_129095/g.373614 Transcript_129095/m.373614 type:complete len:121 (-) Transcript_129095:943-1305(-)
MPAGPSNVRNASAAALPAGACPEPAKDGGVEAASCEADIGDAALIRIEAEPTGDVLTMLPALPAPRAFGDGAAVKEAPPMMPSAVGEAHAGMVLAVGVRAEASKLIGGAVPNGGAVLRRN